MTPTQPAAPPGCIWLKGAAKRLGFEVSTLRKWRQKRIGPPSFRVGGRVAYRISELDAWLARQESSDPHSNPDLDPARAPVAPRVPAAA